MIISVEELAKHSVVFLVDFSWVSYRGHFAFSTYNKSTEKYEPNLTINYKGQVLESGHIYGVLNTLRLIKTRFPKAPVVFCIDGLDYKQIVLEKFPDSGYKQNRKGSISFQIHRDMTECLSMCCAFPDTYYIYNNCLEADTLMASLAKSLETYDTVKKLILYTADKDLLQTVSPKIALLKDWKYAPEPLGLMGENYALQEFGVSISQIPLYRSVIGDASDNLKGISRFPKKLLCELLTESNVQTPEEFYSAIVAHPDLKKITSIQNLIRDFEKVRINYQLMKIKPHKFQVERMESKQLQKDLFYKWQMGTFESFLANYPSK